MLYCGRGGFVELSAWVVGGGQELGHGSFRSEPSEPEIRQERGRPEERLSGDDHVEPAPDHNADQQGCTGRNHRTEEDDDADGEPGAAPTVRLERDDGEKPVD